MLKLKGTTIYPPAINDVLNQTDYVQNYIVYARTSSAGTDDVLVRVGLRPEMHNLSPEEAIKDLKDRFRARLRVAPAVELAPAGEIQALNFPAKARKPVQFIDLRR